MFEPYTDLERGSCARGDGGGTRRVAELVHGAREAIRGAQVSGALRVGDHGARHRQDGPG